MRNLQRVFLWVWLGVMSSVAAERSVFSNPDIHGSYSALLIKKQSVKDSLLPPLDGDKTFNELIRGNPKLWSIERLDKLGDMVTRLKVEIVYLDGINEDQFCELDKGAESSSDVWNLRIGVDFTSGESNTVPVHIQQCLEYVRNELGYKVKKGDRVVEIPSKKIMDEIKQSHIPDVLDPDLQAKLLKAHREVKVKGDCPTDIEAYAILLDVWDEVKGGHMDLGILNDYLNPDRNKGRTVHSCAFSREWNEKYSEDAALYCDESTMWCKYVQSQDGTTRWQLDVNSDALVFQPFLGLFGGKSVRDGGKMLDLRILPLSSSMFLEAYLDEKGFPLSLGLVTVPELPGQ